MAFSSHACVARAAPRVRRRPPDLGGQDPVRHTRAPKNTHEATVISAHMYFGNDPTIIPDPTRPTRRPNHSTHQPPPIDTLFPVLLVALHEQCWVLPLLLLSISFPPLCSQGVFPACVLGLFLSHFVSCRPWQSLAALRRVRPEGFHNHLPSFAP